MRRALPLLGLLLVGCPKQEEAPPEFDPADRTLQKLKAEQERLARLPPPRPKEPEPDPLAEIAAAPKRPEQLGIPSGVEGELGTVSLRLLEVEQSQTVSGGKVSLSTAERFLKVTLEARSTTPLDLDLSGATLSQGEHSVPIARDVQRVGGGSSLITSLGTGQERELVLYFEAPDEMIGKGLKIILTSPGSRVELPLQ